jgi:hypothetical protein
VDRFSAWVERLPVTPLFTYIGLYLVIVIFITVTGWFSGLVPYGKFQIQQFIFLVFTFEVFYFNSLSYRWAVDALRRSRPLLKSGDVAYQGFEFEFAILPRKAVNLITLSMVLLSAYLGYADQFLFKSPAPFTLREVIGSFFVWVPGIFSAAFLAYRSIRQIRKVNQAYSLVREIDLYNLRPVYVLSSYTSKTSLVFLFILYSTMLAQPSNFEVGAFFLGSLAFSLIALAGFALPLLGINRRLVDAKATLLQEVDSQVRGAFDRLTKEQATKKLENIGNTRQLVDAVIRRREYIQSIPTWPWQSGTLRSLLLGVFLPIMIWLIQQLLLRTVVK